MLVVLLSGCSYSTFYVPSDQGVYPPTNADMVAISSQLEIKSAHRKLGSLAVIVWGDGESARKELQSVAAKIGANAVIQYRIERSFMRTSASGLAVALYR
jgi:hypothetical protein